jgi:hypothetical protein
MQKATVYKMNFKCDHKYENINFYIDHTLAHVIHVASVWSK